jgi:hypothetical protein
MDLSARIRLALAAAVLAVVYYYLLIYLIGWSSLLQRPAWWFRASPTHRCRYLAGECAYACGFIWGFSCRISIRGHCAKQSSAARRHCGRSRDSSGDIPVAEPNNLAPDLEQSSCVFHNGPDQTSCCRAFSRMGQLRGVL